MFADCSISLQFIENISDILLNLVLTIKAAKSFVKLISVDSIKFVSEKCVAFHHLLLTARRMRCVERGHVTLPQINS